MCELGGEFVVFFCKFFFFVNVWVDFFVLFFFCDFGLILLWIGFVFGCVLLLIFVDVVDDIVVGDCDVLFVVCVDEWVVGVCVGVFLMRFNEW